MTRPSGTYRLTPQLIAAHAGSRVVCLAPSAIGQSFRLHASRPGKQTNRTARVTSAGAVVIDPSGAVTQETTEAPPVTLVYLSGVIEQRAGYHTECGGWSDGHDAVAERMIEALESSDVLLVVDSPGGAHAGLEQAVLRVVRAKEAHGRRVTVYVDEQCGSAAFWWAACVGDEIYAPPSGTIGSIGARGAHGSEAGALAKAGVEVTFFAWPGPGKIAFAPELPLSDLGRARGERDVSLAGESFAAAVGARRGMSREEIIALDADMLCGQAAIDAKILDGVASFEEVLQYCVTLGESVGDSDMTQAAKNTVAHAASGALALRTEGDEPEGDEPEKPKGMEPDAICKSCGHQQEMDAKYCDQCGSSMEAEPLPEDEEDEPEKEDEADEPKKDERASVPPPGAPDKEDRAIPPARSTAVPFTTLAGVRKGASEIATKTALVRKLRVVDYVAKLTGTTDEGEMLGQLKALAEDARASGKLRATIHTLRTRADSKERVDLLLSLAAAGLPDYPRGNLLIDEVNDAGRIVSTQPTAAYAEMRIATLRGLVKGKLANAAPARTPFVAEADQGAAKASVLSYKVEEAKKNPVVANVVKNGIDADVAAGIYAREFGGKS